MTINEKAPVTASGTVDVRADSETIWKIMTDIDNWPNWNPDVRSATLDGELTEGTTFEWKAGPGTITSTLQEVEWPRRLGWTGRMLGIRAVHVWRLEPQDGRTTVRTEESWEGFVVRFLRPLMQKMLQKAIADGLHHLKNGSRTKRWSINVVNQRYLEGS